MDAVELDSKKIYVLAFYIFTSIDDPDLEVAKHRAFLEGKDVKMRTYISHEGINGQMSASEEAAEQYMQWLTSDPRFASVEFKIHYYHEHVFPRCIVKRREQIVALDAKVDLTKVGQHVSSTEWKKMLEEKDENTLLIDVRNNYEWEVGHFEGAELPNLEKFRQFPQYAKELREKHDPKTTKIMMYCTGGIRCEPYSALLRQEGFEHVFQLQGGVIKYGLTEGTQGWLGKLFVFDDRMTVPLREGEKTEVIGRCIHCQEPSESYYNCANMDCNELFLCCPTCAEKTKGCCSFSCKGGERCRPFVKQDLPKPFGKWYRYLRSKEKP